MAMLSGFLTFTNHWPESAEITWMAVSAERRRRGIGRVLIEYALAGLASQGTKFVVLLTLGPSVPDDVADGYQGTRRFYEAVGLTPLREFGLRDWEDEAALLLVRSKYRRSRLTGLSRHDEKVPLGAAQDAFALKAEGGRDLP